MLPTLAMIDQIGDLRKVGMLCVFYSPMRCSKGGCALLSLPLHLPHHPRHHLRHCLRHLRREFDTGLVVCALDTVDN